MHRHINRLKRISLFHTGLFVNEEIVLDTNTMLFGTNGAGKTTSLALLTFFATGNKDLLRGNKKGKLEFFDYFFKANNSFIVYEYEKTEHNVLVAVYAKENVSKLTYKFILMEKKPYKISDIFNQNSRAEVLNMIDASAISSIEIDEKSYLSVLYGESKKGIDIKPYCFSHVRNHETFVHLYKSSFDNISMTSKGIKNIILEYVYAKRGVGKNPVNLDKYAQGIIEFQKSYNAIMEWNKHSDSIVVIKEHLQQIEWAQKEQQQALLQMQQESRWYVELTESKAHELKVKNAYFEKYIRDEVPIKRKEYTDRKNKAFGELDRRKIKIATLEERYKHYQENSMLIATVRIYPEYENLVSQLERNKKILDTLQEKTKTEEEKLVLKKEQLLRHYEENIRHNQSTFDVQKSTYLQKQLEETEYIDKQRKRIEDEFLQLEPKERKKQNLQEEKNEKYLRLLQLKQVKFSEQERCIQLQSNIKKIDTEINLTEKKITLNENKQKHLILEERSFQENQEKEKNKLRKELIDTLKAVDEKIVRIDRLANSSDTLYAKIQMAGLDIEKYTSLLTMEALESHDFTEDKTANGTQVLDFSISEKTNLFNAGLTLHQIIKGYKEEKETLKKRFKAKEKTLSKEYNNFYDDYRKKYELLKEDSESLNKLKFEYTHQIEELEESLEKAQRYWEDDHKLHQERIQKEENDISAQLSTLNHEIVTLKREKNDALKLLEKNRYNAKIAISQSQKELDEKNRKLKISYEKSIQEENNRYQNILKDSGLEFKEIERYNKESEALKEKIVQIDNYRVSIEEYQKFLEEEWKGIIDLKYAYEKEQKVYEAIESEVEEGLEQIENNQRNLKIELENLKKLLTSIDKQKIKLDDALSEYWDRVESLAPLPGKTKEAQVQADIENDADRILAKFAKAMQTYHNEKEELERTMQKKWATFISQEIIDFSTDMLENARRIVKADNSDEIGKQIDKSFLQIKLSIDAIASHYIELQDGYREVKNAIHKINKDLEDISSTSLIESIELRTQDKINGIDEEMKRLTNYWEEHQSNMQQTLFSTKYNSKHKHEILDRLKSFLEKLESLSPKEKELSIGSLFTLQGRIVEKGNDSQWQDNIFDAGSEGTRLLIKVAFIASLFSMALHGSKDEQIPYIVIDEIGKLHNNNVERVLKYINQKGSYLVAVQPNSAMARFFNKAYLLDDVTPQETRIIEYIRKKKVIKLKGEEGESFTS